jgi:Ig-like domain from next to BRCA1 gene
MTRKKVLIFIFTILAISIVLMGCSPKVPASPTTNPDLIYTAAAQTADVRLTQIFRSTPSVTPLTPTPTFDAVQTMAAQTLTALLTQAAGLTPTSQETAPSTPVPTGPSGDRAIFVKDVTIPDGTVLAPGAAFTKIWKLQNAGTSTWTSSYSLAFVSGEQMGTITSVPLEQSVPPGQQIDVSVNLVAPVNPGTYQGYWKMKNASGQFFNDAVYVLIAVGNAGITPTATAGTPVATPTSTGVPSDPITSLTMAVDNPSANECPHTFIFTAWVTLNQRATLTYKLEAGSDTGYSFDLPDPQTGTFEPGTYPILFEMTFTSAGSGWVSFHVTSPVDKGSNQAAFTLTCGR